VPAVVPVVGVWVPSSRRAAANATHPNGEFTGAPGLLVADCGSPPSHDINPANNPPAMFGGVDGVLDGAAVATTAGVPDEDGELTDAAGSVEDAPTGAELWVIVMLGAASVGDAVCVAGVDVDGEVADGDPTLGVAPEPPVVVELVLEP